MTHPTMTPVEARAWLATEDISFSNKCRNLTPRRLCIALAIRRSGGAEQHCSSEDAERALTAKGAKLGATGWRGDFSGPTGEDRIEFTGNDWLDIRETAAEDAYGKPVLVPTVGQKYWHAVHFDRALVLSEFPAKVEQQPIASSDDAPPLSSEPPTQGAHPSRTNEPPVAAADAEVAQLLSPQPVTSSDAPTADPPAAEAAAAQPLSPELATSNDIPTSAPATEPIATAAEAEASQPLSPQPAIRHRANKSEGETHAAVNHIIALTPEGRDVSTAIRENFSQLGYRTFGALERSYHRHGKSLRSAAKIAERMSAANRRRP